MTENLREPTDKFAAQLSILWKATSAVPQYFSEQQMLSVPAANLALGDAWPGREPAQELAPEPAFGHSPQPVTRGSAARRRARSRHGRGIEDG